MRELKREIEDLKERLNMAAEEYKALYIEKKKYQKAAEKLQKSKDYRLTEKVQKSEDNIQT
jgi:regulator of replication initiation timing